MIRTYLLVVFCMAAHLAAATLEGKIEDKQGGAIPDARLHLYRQDNNFAIDSSSNSTGTYSFEDLAPGNYILNISKDEFRSAVINVHIDQANTTRSLNATLQIAGVNQTVVVTAANAAQTLNEVSKALTVISKEEIDDRNDYALSEVLRTTPGVQILNSGGPGQNTSMRIRGLRPDATAFLIDGLRFRDASTVQGDASSFLSALNVVDPGHIEILRGSGSSLYGTNAAGGAVNIVTDQGGGQAHGQLQAEGGNLGLFRGRGNVAGGALGDRLKYSAGLLHLNVTSGVDGQDANRSTGLQGFLRYDFTPRISLSGRLWGSDDFVQLNNSPTTSGIPSANLPPTGGIQAIPLSTAGQQIVLAGGRPNFGSATYVPAINDPDSRRTSRFLNSAFIFRQILAPRFSWQTSYQRVHTDRVYENGPVGVGLPTHSTQLWQLRWRYRYRRYPGHLAAHQLA